MLFKEEEFYFHFSFHLRQDLLLLLVSPPSSFTFTSHFTSVKFYFHFVKFYFHFSLHLRQVLLSLLAFTSRFTSVKFYFHFSLHLGQVLLSLLTSPLSSFIFTSRFTSVKFYFYFSRHLRQPLAGFTRLISSGKITQLKSVVDPNKNSIIHTRKSQLQ
jgi:hypothetical protein